MPQITLVSFVYVGLGLILALTALPMWLRLVPPNAWYGFRTAKSLSNEEVWYAINQTAGRDIFFAGVAVSAGAIIILFVAKDRRLIDFFILNLMLLVAAVGTATIHSFCQLAHIARVKR